MSPRIILNRSRIHGINLQKTQILKSKMENSIKILEQTLHHRFTKKQLAYDAIIHPSFAKSNFEILEFVGDKAIGLGITQMLYSQDIKTEKKFAQIFVSMTNKYTLLKSAYNMSLDKIIFWKGEINHRDTVLSDACEAVFGALFLDTDTDISTVSHNIKKYWPCKTEDFIDIDPRSYVQKWAYENNVEKKYSIVDHYGSPHKKTYISMLTIEQYSIQAEGSSKKEAYKNAAKKFIEHIIKK